MEFGDPLLKLSLPEQALIITLIIIMVVFIVGVCSIHFNELYRWIMEVIV